jgi:phage terminase large subunit GpA-like protein
LSWWKKVAEAFIPPPQMTIDAWADRYRRIPPEFAAEPGDWSTKRVPYMRAVMQACSPSHDCRRVVLVKPTQSGGTEAAILNTIGFTIDINPQSMLVIFPTIDLAQSFSRERLEPMVDMMPRLKDKVADVQVGPDTQNRSSVKRKRFPGGFLNFGGANSAAGLSSRPVPIVLMDEVDSCIQNAGSSGNPVKLLAARTTAFIDRKEIYISSPSNDVAESGILEMWRDSSQGRLETQCPNPQCAHWQVLEWEQMDLDSATLGCVKCGQYFQQHQWNRGEEFERWRFDNPGHPTTMGFRLSGLNSPWLNWEVDLCAEYKEAKRIADMGDDSLMRVFVNTKLAQSYRVLGKRVEIDLYNDRREVYACHARGAELPDGVIILTAAVDVHDKGLYYEVVGWAKGRESWGVECGEFPGDPRNLGSDGPWDQIDRFVYRRVFRYADGQHARIRLIFVDSGGHCTSEVYQYCKRRQPRAFAIKGQGGGTTGKPIIIGGKSRERHEGAWLLRLGVDTLKDEFHSRLSIDKPGPGFCHWPMQENGADAMGYGEEYFAQLLAEQRVLRYNRGGFARYEWHKHPMDTNEALDLRCYARAALEYLRVRLEQIPRDVIARFNPQNIEKVEVGLGREILVEKPRTKSREYKLGAQQRAPSTTTTMGGLEQAPEPTVQWIGSAGQSPKRPSARYGAIGSVF